jgi:hypothetical protein
VDEIIFETIDLIPLQADADRPAWPLITRRKPSNRPRQPVATRYPGAKPTFGPGFLEDRPECATIIARCVSVWSYIENELALLLASVLKINTEPAVAMFLAIQSGRTQMDVLQAAAKVVLNESDYELFGAIMNIKAVFEKERNDLVHGLYGSSMLVKEGILWIEQKHLTNHTALVWSSDFTNMDQQRVLRNTFVYEPSDLETVAQNLEWLHGMIGSFRGYTTSENTPRRGERYHQLCAEPRIEQELSRMRAGQKKNQPVRGKPPRKGR